MKLFAGTYDGGVFLSTNNGATWTAVNAGLPNAFVTALALSGTDLFAGTYNSGVWRRPLSEMITSVKVSPGEVPAVFRLEQNYPNPFNPSTTIQFSLARAAYVTLKIFDTLGEQVATLLSQELAAGAYTTTWSASSLPSGVYFCNLKAGGFVKTRAMILLK